MNGSALSANTILSRLEEAPEFASIEKRFSVSPLVVNGTVQKPDEPMKLVFFPLSGMLSTTSTMETGETVEICCVGVNGMVNWETLFGQRQSRFHHFGQISGTFASIGCKYLLPFVHNAAISTYVTRVCGEVSQAAACNCVHTAEERLAKWLLLAADKVRSDHLALTQEFLAMMLGARRATVTIAAGHLQRAGFISYHRGDLRILDRVGLISAACECYVRVRPPEAHRN